jgi:hypothetical protein
MNDAAESPENAVSGEPRNPRAAGTLRRFVAWSCFGGAVGLAAALVALRQANYDPAPALTPQAYEAAYARWRAREISDYDIEIRVTGPQAATYRASVRNGEPTAAWRNGKPLTTRRTFGTWSVPGMFSTISRDIAAVEQAAAKGRPTPLILRAAFNAERGYPERYRRIDNGSRKGSDAIAVTWDVIAFEIVSPQSAESASGPIAPGVSGANDP